MNKYDAIDPEFLSEKTDDGLDFVKYMTYITALESRLPGMVAQCAQGGTLDEKALRALLDGMKCNYGMTELLKRVMVRLLKDTLGIDFQPLFDEADAKYPMGKHPMLVTVAVQHRGDASKLAAVLKEKGDALDKSRETVEHQWQSPAAQAQPRQEEKAAKVDVEETVALEHRKEQQEAEELDPNTQCVRAIHAMGVPTKKAEEIVKRHNELGGKEEMCLYVDEELVNAQPNRVITEQQAMSIQWARAVYRAVGYNPDIAPNTVRNVLRDYFNAKNGRKK